MEETQATLMWGRRVLIAIIVAILVVTAWILRSVILLVLTAALAALIIDFPIRALSKRGVKRGVATGIVIACLLVIVVLLSVFLLPVVIRQTNLLVNETLPSAIEQTTAWIEAQDFSDETVVMGLQMPSAEEIMQNLSTQVGGLLQQLTQIVPAFFGSILSGILAFFIMLFLVIFLLAEPETYRNGLMLLVNPSHHDNLSRILKRLDRMLRQWVQVTFISMIFLAVATTLGFWLIGIEEALILGLIAGTFSFIPNFGPLFGLVPLLIVTISDPDANLLLGILILYGMTFIQNQILLPILMSEQVKIPAVLVLVGQIVFGIFFGFLGLLLAVPLLVIITVLVQEIYVRGILGNQEMKIYSE